MTTANKTLSILRSEIPAGGFGRELTSTEARELRAAGYSVPRGSAVLRAHGLSTRGYFYRPAAGGGLTSVAGVVLVSVEA